MKFRDKKILILGCNVLADSAVTYVRRNGGYTIVTDYLTKDESRPKQLANEYWNISTADIDKLISKCKDNSVDAVFSGISEFNLISAMKVMQGIGKHFYFNQKQWDMIENKSNFRTLCEKYKVPAPKTYFAGTHSEFKNFSVDNMKYPLVVKPVDCAASDGVSICEDKSDLMLAVDRAFKTSSLKRIIIEEFIKGYEFTAHYTICKGKARLTHIDNRYPISLHEGSVTTIPIARIYPSLFIKPYFEQVNENMINLCENIGLGNAVLFVQGFYNKENDFFRIFEAGLRPAAESPCRFSEVLTGQNHYYMLIDNLMGCKTDYNVALEDPYMNSKVCGIVSLVGKSGTVTEINGLNMIKNMSGLQDYECRYPVGTTLPNTDSLRQLALRFLLINDSREKMVEDISFINHNVSMLDENGKEMLIRMNPESILEL